MNRMNVIRYIMIWDSTSVPRWVPIILIGAQTGVRSYRATPFWTTTFPECKWRKGGNPFSLRKSSPSNIWRPNLATCHAGSPVPAVPYLRLYSSFHVLCRTCKIILLTLLKIKLRDRRHPTVRNVILVPREFLQKFSPICITTLAQRGD